MSLVAYQRVHIAFLERVAILGASSPTLSTIVYASERAYCIWPSDNGAQQAWMVCGGVCAEAWGGNEMEEPTHQRVRVHI